MALIFTSIFSKYNKELEKQFIFGESTNKKDIFSNYEGKKNIFKKRGFI